MRGAGAKVGAGLGRARLGGGCRRARLRCLSALRSILNLNSPNGFHPAANSQAPSSFLLPQAAAASSAPSSFLGAPTGQPPQQFPSFGVGNGSGPS